jgi:hypothetical protein
VAVGLVRSPRPSVVKEKEAVGLVRRRAQPIEAPDRGESCREAPESWVDRVAEAPDAGEGPVSYGTHEFTVGRSQS